MKDEKTANNLKDTNQTTKYTGDKTYKPVKPKGLSAEFHIFNRVPTVDLIFSIQNMAIMLNSGLSIQDTLEIISTQAQSFKLKQTYANILADVNGGLTLTESLKKYPKIFSNLIVSITNAGEQSGSLEKNFTYLADYLKKEYTLKKKIKGALFYPLLVLGLTFVEFNVVIFFVLPQLENLFASFPTDSVLTKAVLGGGRFVRSNTIYLAAGLAVSIVAIFSFLKTPAGQMVKDFLSLRIPIIKKLTKEIILSNFSRTFSLLLQSGIPVYDALTISTQSIDNYFYKSALETIKKNVLSGNDVSSSMTNFPQYFPSIFSKMLEAGEKAGALEQNLFAMHEYYSQDVEELSNNLATIIEPFLLIFIGLVVGLLATAVIVPLYSVISNIHA